MKGIRYLQYKFRRRLFAHMEKETVVVRGIPIILVCHSMNDLWRAGNFSIKEPETLDWIDTHFGPQDVFWDIGAHIGQYSLYAHLKTGCTVFAFEPHPLNYAMLYQNAVANRVNHSNKFAISPNSFALNDSGIRLSTVLMESCRIGEPNQYTNFLEVDLNRIAMTSLLTDRVDHIKIDVEDFTLVVLQGIKPVLSHIKSLQLECEPHCRTIVDKLLKAHGLVMRQVTPIPHHEKANYLYKREGL